MSRVAAGSVAAPIEPSAPAAGRSATVAWPGWRHLVRTLWYSAGVSVLFAMVYGGADALARVHDYRVDLTIGADRFVPFVPEATLIYSSLYAMFWVTPFVLRTDREVRGLARVIALQIVIAGPFFVALPAEGPAVPADVGRFERAFRMADSINLEHNHFPSLHATFAFTMAAVLARRCRPPARLGLAVWSAAVALSTLLTRQHFIVDLAGAAVLAVGVLAFQQRFDMRHARR